MTSLFFLAVKVLVKLVHSPFRLTTVLWVNSAVKGQVSCYFPCSTGAQKPDFSQGIVKRKKKKGSYLLLDSHFYGGDYKPDDDDC